MSYIYRELQDFIKQKMMPNQPFGLILTGIVGCGKTTLIEAILNDFKIQNIPVFKFTGDDVQFRVNVAENSNYIIEYVSSITQLNSIVFVDEVQKTEFVFDALKIAFDSKKISFIVSGSNPAYLTTIAKKRLQRRAEQVFMLPFSLAEIFLSKKLVDINYFEIFSHILFRSSFDDLNIKYSLTKTEEMNDLITQFFSFGGLPLSYLASSEDAKLSQVRLSTERGFELLSTDNDNISEQIKIELAKLNSREFTYQNILAKTRLRKRDTINNVISELMNHGYLVKKKPLLLTNEKSSYLSVYSYVDPGILTYLIGESPKNEKIGASVEGYVHTRLDYYLKNFNYKCELGYYKPHQLDSAGNIKYLNGEIDFILKKGSRIIPVEVKTSSTVTAIKVELLIEFVKSKKQVPFGIVIYGGVPHLDFENKILYWPYWLI